MDGCDFCSFLLSPVAPRVLSCLGGLPSVPLPSHLLVPLRGSPCRPLSAAQLLPSRVNLPVLPGSSSFPAAFHSRLRFCPWAFSPPQGFHELPSNPLSAEGGCIVPPSGRSVPVTGSGSGVASFRSCVSCSVSLGAAAVSWHLGGLFICKGIPG